jgi:hypothetical protein
MSDERLLKIEAELLAQRALLRALMESHNAVALLQRNFETVSEAMIAELLPTGLPESLLDMCRARLEGIRGYLLRLRDRVSGRIRNP